MSKSYWTFFILGPSGAGKSCFSQYLNKEINWLHLEIDQFTNDGIAVHDLRREWDAFYISRDPGDLSEALCERTVRADKPGCVVSFPGNLVLSPEHITAAEKASIEVAYLYGSAAHCVNSFLKREHKSGRRLDLYHWLSNNSRAYLEMSHPRFEPYRVHVFDIYGNHRPCPDVLREIKERWKLRQLHR